MVSKDSIQRLTDAMDTSYRDLEPFRQNSLEAIQQYCGRHYGKNSDDIARVPVNFIQFAVATYVQKIAANRPKWLVRTDHFELAETSDRLQMALNHVAKEINIQESLEAAATNAMFNIGIVKIGVEEVDRGMLGDATQPYVESIDFSDFVFDTNAKSFEFCQFMGHKFTMDRETFEGSGLYKNTDQVGSIEDGGRARGDDYSPTEMVHDRGWETYRELVELWEIFLPFENVILTMSVDDGNIVCREQTWNGSELGPYRFLRFHKVPGNIMPVAPTSLWMDLHEMGNDLFRKMRDQAERQKTVTAYSAGAKDDMRRIRDAGDGDTILTTQPDGVREHAFGGVDQGTAATFMMTKDLMNTFTGNVDSLAGLGAQSDTASQDAMIGQAAGSRVEDMHQKYLKFCKQVGEAVADELWNDPLIDIPLTKQVPNFGIRIPTKFSADTLEGDFLDYNFSVDPYSTTHQSPPQRLNTIIMLLERIIAPMLPFFQQQGGQVNMQALVAMAAKYSGTEEFENVVSFGDLDQGGDNAPIMPTTGASHTTREYVRKNVPTGGTQSFRDQQMAQSFLGNKTQPKEAGAMMRQRA